MNYARQHDIVKEFSRLIQSQFHDCNEITVGLTYSWGTPEVCVKVFDRHVWSHALDYFYDEKNGLIKHDVINEEFERMAYRIAVGLTYYVKSLNEDIVYHREQRDNAEKELRKCRIELEALKKTMLVEKSA
jgi:hypothetical protein